MFVLYETPAGYAIFKLLDQKKLEQVDNLYLEFKTPEKANQIVKLKHFQKFADTTEALSAATATVEVQMDAKPVISADSVSPTIPEISSLTTTTLSSCTNSNSNISQYNNGKTALTPETTLCGLCFQPIYDQGGG